MKQDATKTCTMAAVTNTGENLADLSQTRPLLVVFLRHSGCPFCREALAEIAEKRDTIQHAGVGIVLVHMYDDEFAANYFAKYGLDDLPRISDPECEVYRAFGLQRGSHRQVAGPRVWWRGMVATIFKRHGVGRMIGDVLQMPGAFMVHKGEIIRSFEYRTSADRPDYGEFATCDLPSAQDS